MEEIITIAIEAKRQIMENIEKKLEEETDGEAMFAGIKQKYNQVLLEIIIDDGLGVEIVIDEDYISIIGCSNQDINILIDMEEEEQYHVIKSKKAISNILNIIREKSEDILCDMRDRIERNENEIIEIKRIEKILSRR